MRDRRPSRARVTAAAVPWRIAAGRFRTAGARTSTGLSSPHAESHEITGHGAETSQPRVAVALHSIVSIACD
jgi:hypothetical protein